MLLRSKLLMFTATFSAVFVLAGSVAHAQSGPGESTSDLGGSNPNIVNPDDPNLPSGERPQTPIEASIMSALRVFAKQSPAVFDAVCWQCSKLPQDQREDFFNNWQVQGPFSVLTDSMTAPSNVWDYGVRLNSKLVAMRMDIFIEGFYRNMEFEAGGQKKIAQPWFKYNATTKTYTAKASGAGPVIYRNLLLQKTNYDAKTGLVTLYRGTSQAEADRLAQIQKLAGNPATSSQAVAQAKTIATTFKNGLFAADLRDTAERYSTHVHDGKPAVLTVKISATALKSMIDHGDVYMGYEMGYFELGFLSEPAIMIFAQGLQK